MSPRRKCSWHLLLLPPYLRQLAAPITRNHRLHSTTASPGHSTSTAKMAPASGSPGHGLASLSTVVSTLHDVM